MTAKPDKEFSRHFLQQPGIEPDSGFSGISRRLGLKVFVVEVPVRPVGGSVGGSQESSNRK